MKPDVVAKKILGFMISFALIVTLITTVFHSTADNSYDPPQPGTPFTPISIDWTPLLTIGEYVGLALIAVVLFFCVRSIVRHLPYVQRLRLRVYLDKPKQKKGLPRRLGADGELLVADDSESAPQSLEDALS